MGYETSYYGDIELKNKKAINILKKLINDGEFELNKGNDELLDNELELFAINGLELKKSCLSVSCYGKTDSEEMLKFCLFVANLDKNASGEIDCEGEETADVWKIIISEGKVRTKQGNIVFDEYGEAFDDIETKKKVYDIIKDKDLLKEIIIDNLEK